MGKRGEGYWGGHPYKATEVVEAGGKKELTGESKLPKHHTQIGFNFCGKTKNQKLQGNGGEKVCATR